MAKNLRFITIFSILILYACTQQDWYRGAQQYQNAKCMEGPISEYENCTIPVDENYEQYNKKRELLMEETTLKN